MAETKVKKLSDTGWVTVTTGLSCRLKNGICTVVGNDLTIQAGAIRSFTLPEFATNIAPVDLNPFCRSGTVLLQCWISGRYLNIDPGGSTKQHTALFISYPV